MNTYVMTNIFLAVHSGYNLLNSFILLFTIVMAETSFSKAFGDSLDPDLSNTGKPDKMTPLRTPFGPFYKLRTASLAQQGLLATPPVSTHAQSRLLDV
uniref:Uncharacterized protein n=1 Tax=Timema genevievae TaxID=629358 RepID=A0A7R9PPU7_TIMGE|nr:unnamed protein product [Timema genevievae]